LRNFIFNKMNGHNVFFKSKTVYLQGFWPKSVYLKCFGIQLKTVYLRGPHFSRPCISRPCCRSEIVKKHIKIKKWFWIRVGWKTTVIPWLVFVICVFIKNFLQNSHFILQMYHGKRIKMRLVTSLYFNFSVWYL
jgi:hypothetical protein